MVNGKKSSKTQVREQMKDWMTVRSCDTGFNCPSDSSSKTILTVNKKCVILNAVYLFTYPKRSTNCVSCNADISFAISFCQKNSLEDLHHVLDLVSFAKEQKEHQADASRNMNTP